VTSSSDHKPLIGDGSTGHSVLGMHEPATSPNDAPVVVVVVDLAPLPDTGSNVSAVVQMFWPMSLARTSVGPVSTSIMTRGTPNTRLRWTQIANDKRLHDVTVACVSASACVCGPRMHLCVAVTRRDATWCLDVPFCERPLCTKARTRRGPGVTKSSTVTPMLVHHKIIEPWNQAQRSLLSGPLSAG
jgi:hypothetical protein